MRFSILLKELREASTTETFWGLFLLLLLLLAVLLLAGLKSNGWLDCRIHASGPACVQLTSAQKRLPFLEW